MLLAFIRFGLIATLLSVILTITACCDQKSSHEQSRITAVTVTPATPPKTVANPSAIESYSATLNEGIDFTKHGYPTFIAEVTGMSAYEPWGRWTDGAKAVFRFNQQLPKRFTLVIQANVFGPNIGQAVKIKVGVMQQEFKVSQQGEIQRLDFTLPESTDTIALIIPKPTSPKDLQIGEDPRQLGLGLIKLQIQAHDSQAFTSLTSH